MIGNVIACFTLQGLLWPWSYVSWI